MLLNTPVGQAMTPATTEVDGSRREVEFLHTAPTGLSPRQEKGTQQPPSPLTDRTRSRLKTELSLDQLIGAVRAVVDPDAPVLRV